MKVCKVNRRRFILAGLLLSPCMLYADARWIEPSWLKVRRLRLAKEKPSHRLIHFTDLHHKGDRAYGEAMVKTINSLSPDFVCFTGDLIEDGAHLAEALEILSEIKSPLYGVPGNHDYWSKVPFDGITKIFAATGGGWLLDQQVRTQDGKVNIIGASCLSATQPPMPAVPGVKNIFLMHYPAWVKKLGHHRYDVLLAGHSHGGQVRIPFYGPVVVPFGVDEFDLGLFQTPCGPLYVGSGIGWFLWPMRFRCRPEITVIEI
ncbi:MAG: metallophosphoesterase [Verrucomicrobiota bacterium]|nr:metallophosphoesterase [Limisphaerales bacterium]